MSSNRERLLKLMDYLGLKRWLRYGISLPKELQEKIGNRICTVTFDREHPSYVHVDAYREHPHNGVAYDRLDETVEFTDKMVSATVKNLESYARRRAEEAVLERQRKDLIELADAELRRAGLL